MTDLISVIIPVYNRQDVIEACVRSVTAQSHSNHEILLIDDGSSDETPSICRRLAEQEPRIRLLESEHGGVSAARNAGLEAARGEYVFFLDSDDLIHPTLLEGLVNGLKNSDAAMAGTGVAHVPEKYWHLVSQRITEDSGPGDLTVQNHEDTVKAFFHSTTPLNMIGGVMMRRDLIGQTRFRTDLHIGEDYYFVYENLIKGAGSVFLNPKRYYAKLHAANSSWDYSFAGFWSRFLRRKLVWESEERLGRPDCANRQKQDGLNVFLRCVVRNKPHSEDAGKMRRVLREHGRILLPALSATGKLRYFCSVYLPTLYWAASKAKSKLKKRRRGK